MAAALFRSSTASSFDGLYRRHVASVYRYAFAVVGNHADAEDITQQTFLNAYRAMSEGTKPRKAENWLLTIAHNEVRRHFRDSYRKGQEVEFDEQLAPPAPEPYDHGVADVLRALRHIPPAQRSALVMREFEGRSYAEIAGIMGISERALETLIFRARRSLAEQLEGALTCAEAEEAFLRRVDGRLPRREARRLRRHVKECLPCARFGRVQKQQRALLKGLSVMPVPASIFLFRGQTAAAATGGTASVAAGAGATGAATGLVAKAAAITAAAVVAGGVGYQVAAKPAPAAKAEPDAVAPVQRAKTPKPSPLRPLVVSRPTPRPAIAPSFARRAAKKAKPAHAQGVSTKPVKTDNGRRVGPTGTPPGQVKKEQPASASVVKTRPSRTRPLKPKPTRQAPPKKAKKEKPARELHRTPKPPAPPTTGHEPKPVKPPPAPAPAQANAAEPKKPVPEEKANRNQASG